MQGNNGDEQNRCYESDPQFEQINTLDKAKK